MRESSDPQRETSLENSLSHLRLYVPEDYVDHSVEKSPIPAYRYQKYREPPEIFTHDKYHGYYAANRIIKAIFTGAINMGEVPYYQFIHDLVLNHESVFF